MFRFSGLLVVGMVLGIAGCVNMEQVYEGMYKGSATANEMQENRDDPAYNPVQDNNKNTLNYQEYKREREQVLKDEDSTQKN